MKRNDNLPFADALEPEFIERIYCTPGNPPGPYRQYLLEGPEPNVAGLLNRLLLDFPDQEITEKPWWLMLPNSETGEIDALVIVNLRPKRPPRQPRPGGNHARQNNARPAPR